MKVIKIDTESTLSVMEIAAPIGENLRKELDGYIELVHPMGLSRPYCMVVDEEGLLKALPDNPVGYYLYGTHLHGNPIVGNIFILKEVYGDFAGLSDEEAEILSGQLSPIAETFKNAKEAGII